MMDDDDIQFWWALVCATLDDDLSEILLKKIVKLWITVRGFAYTGAIMEQYHTSAAETTKKKRALRKDLKLKSTSTNEHSCM